MQDLLSIGTNRRESMIGTGIGLGLAGYRLNPPGVLPVLDLRFSQDKSLTAFAGPTPSFSRASSGTYFDANGVLQSAGVNTARFNHVYNGTSWVSRGLLVEEQRTNIWLQSNSLNTSPWTQYQNTSTENAANSPDGTSNASSVVPNTSNLAHYTYQLVTTSAINYSISFYAKKNGYDFVQLSTGISTDYVNFNLNAGAVGNKSSGVYSSAKIESVSNGWYRCSVTIASIAGSYDHGITVINADTASRRPAFAGDGTSGILLYGFQMEAGSFATSLISTTSSSTTRSADVCQITGSDFSGFWNATEGSLAIDCDRLFVGTADNWLYKFNASAGVDNINHQFYNGNDYSRVFYSGAPSAIDYGASSSSGVITKFSGGFSSSGYVGIKNGIIADTKAITTIGTGHNELIIGNGGTSASPANFWNGHISRLRYWNTRLDNGTLRVLST